MASVIVAKYCPKKALNEGITGPPLAHVASYCKCSSFNMNLAFLELALVCFLLVASSLNEIGLWNPGDTFGVLLVFPLLPMFSFILCSLLGILSSTWWSSLLGVKQVYKGFDNWGLLKLDAKKQVLYALHNGERLLCTKQNKIVLILQV